jgi:CheY-like chemotaxis protein
MAKTIVWIDDDIDIIQPVTKLLEREGHRFLHFRTVSEALDNVGLIRSSDIILLDIILPSGKTDEDYGRYAGVELLEELRKQGIDTPVVAFTVVSNAKVQRELHELGVKDIISKPALPSNLKESVDRALMNE